MPRTVWRDTCETSPFDAIAANTADAPLAGAAAGALAAGGLANAPAAAIARSVSSI